MKGRIPTYFVFLGILINCVATLRPYRLSDASENLQKYETSRLNPLSFRPRSIPVTGFLQYDEFFTKSSKSIVVLQTAETVLRSALEKESRNESFTEELEFAEVLAKEIPPILENLPGLENDGKELQKNLQRDFSGRRQSQLPYMAEKLSETLKELQEYNTKAPEIFQNLQRIRSNPETLSGKREPLSKEAFEIASRQEPNVEESLNSQLEGNQDENDGEGKRIPQSPSIEIRQPQFLKSESEEKPTEEDREVREYSKKLKEGLLEVFRAESSKNVRKLSQILLHHPIPRVRAAGASALGRLKGGRKALERAIQIDSYVVRPEAYKSLAEIGDKASLPIFLEGINSEDLEIQAASFLGLGKTKDPIGRALILSRGLSSLNETIVSYSLKGLAYYQILSDLDLISRYLGSDSEKLSRAAIEALSTHRTVESLLILQNALTEYPRLTYLILDAVGKNRELAATFFLVRASQLYENEEILKKIGSLLVQRKAFGTYGMVVVREDRIRTSPNERSREIGIVRLSDVGKVNFRGSKRFVIRMGEELAEDVYYNMTFENRIIGARNRYSRGWIFGKKIQLIQIYPPSQKKQSVLRNLQTGKFQNLYDSY